MADASIRLAVEGGGDFKAAMKAAESSVKLFNTEIKNLATGLTNTSAVQEQTKQKITLLAGASEAAKGKVSLLTSEYNKQRDKLNELAKALETASRENGENSAEAAKAEKALNNQTKVVNDLGVKLSNAQKEADNFEKELKDLENQGNKLGSEFNSLDKEVKNVGDGMNDAGQKTLSFKDVLGANIFGNFITQGVQVAVRELQEFVREIVEVGSTYEAQMAKVSAISGAFKDETGQTMKSLEGLTRELSGYFSALEIGQAMEFQAMAGWDVATIEATTEAILNLAQAGGVDLARASELMTTGMNAFRMTSEDAGEMMQNATRYADVLAVTASSAATDVDSMGEVFAKVAPLAGAMGYTIEDMSLAIGLMANNGLTGAEAGTALRTTLSNLVTPSEKVQKIFDELGITLQNDMGEYYTFEEVLGQLRDGFSGLEKAQKLEYAQEIAGARAKTAFISVIDAQQDSYDALKLAINNSAGAAEEMAQVMGDTYEGDARRAKAATENLQSAIFELFQGPLRRGKQITTDFANGLAEMLRSSDKLVPVLKGVATGVATFAAAMAAAKIANFIASMGGLLGIIPKIQAAFISLNASLGAFGLAALAISAVVSALVIYNETADRTVGIADTLNEKLSENAQRRIDEAEKTREAYEALREAQEARVAADMAELEDVERLAKELEGLVDANGKVQEGEEARAEFIIGKLNQALGLELELVDGLIQGQEDLSGAISDAIAKKEAQLLLEAEQEVYLKALQDKARLERDVAKAYQENEIAIKNVAAAEENLQKAVDDTYNLEEDKTAAVKDASRELENAKRVAEETGQAYLNLSETWGVAVNEIAKYRDAEAAAHEGNYERVREVLLKGQEAFTAYADVANRSIEEQTRTLKEQMDTQYQIYLETYAAVEDKNSEFGRAMIQEAYDLYLQSVDEYNKIGTDTVTAYASGINENTPIAVEAVEGMIDESTDLAYEAKEEAKPIGEALTSGTAEGIDRKKQEVIQKARQLMKDAISAMRAEADINSPARKFRDEVGRYIPLGVADGIKAAANVVREAAKDLVDGIATETSKALPEINKTASDIQAAFDGMAAGFVWPTWDFAKVNGDITAGMLSARDSVTQTGIMQATEAAVNGINMGRMMSGSNQQPVYITLMLDGRQIANAVFDPLKQVSKQRGVSLG